MNLLTLLFGDGVSSKPSKHLGGVKAMNASTKRAPRKAVKKPVISAERKAYLATLPPKLRKLNEQLIPLEGKLTAALALKKW